MLTSVTDSMATMLLATMSLSFIVLCWGEHFLVKTKDPNITNNVHKKGHSKFALEHGEDYQSDYYGYADKDADYYVQDYRQGLDACQECNICKDKFACKKYPETPNLCCKEKCLRSEDCGKDCPVCDLVPIEKPHFKGSSRYGISVQHFCLRT